MPAPFAQSINDFFVGQHGTQRRTPIHKRLALICQTIAVLIQRDRVFALQGDFIRDRQLRDRASDLCFDVEPGVIKNYENLLSPANVGFVSCRDAAVPIVAEPQHLQLASELLDVAIRLHSRMFAGANRVLFGRQPERIEPHRMQDAVAAHPREPRNNISRRVTFGVTDVQPVAAGVGEHIEDVSFFAALAQVWFRSGRERFVLFPISLPAGFDFGRVVSWHLVRKRESFGGSGR